jgi:hypothetical protein
MPKARDFLAKAIRGHTLGRAWARSNEVGPTWAKFDPELFTPFLFPFLLELKQF